MDKSKMKLVVGLGAVVVIGAIIAFVVMSGSNDSSSTNSGTNTNSSSADADSAVETNTVSIKGFAYSPAVIKVKVGTTVTWTNTDDVKHNVVTDMPSGDAPNGELFGKGESFSFTYNKAGTYDYHCEPHPYMKGTVIVTE